MNEIILGTATYTVERVFFAKASVSELIIQRILQEKQENQTFGKHENDSL